MLSKVSAVTEAPPGAESKRPRILLVEDDESLAWDVRDELRSLGYTVDHTGDGAVALSTVRTRRFDLLVMDRMLPGLNGLTVIEEMRSQNIRTPVLVLSALSEVDERVRGLQAGGDDYLTKPFALVELAARVAALLRRPLATPETVLRAGSVEMDLVERVARRGDRVLDLLPREFLLLKYLVSRPDQIVTREMLLMDVWNYRFLRQTNLVDVHMGRLRRKLDTQGDDPLIHSVRGAGFVFRIPE